MFWFLDYDFMQRSLWAWFGVALICPLIGTVLLMRKSVMQADVLSHSALTGVAIGIWSWISPLFTTLVYTMFSSVLVEFFRRFKRLTTDTVFSIFFSANLAIAIYLLSLSNGFTSNLHKYLFWSVTLITSQDLTLLIGVCIITLLCVMLFWRQFWQILIDEPSAQVAWIRVSPFNILIALLVGGWITASITIVGLLLTTTLLTLPLMIAGQIQKSFKKSLYTGAAISLSVTMTGIIGWYYSNIPASALITGILVITFIIVLLVRRKK